MNINKNRHNRFPSRQRGMATVLIALFIGLAVTATALSILHAINSTQERQLGAHAQTHAQGSVWTGAEALRVHLLNMSASDFNNLAVGNQLTITGVGDEVVAVNGSGGGAASAPANNAGGSVAQDTLIAQVLTKTANTTTDPGGATVPDGTFNVTMSLTAIDASAQSSSSLEVVYLVTPGAGQRQSDFGGSPAFERGLTLAGDIGFKGEIKNLHVNGKFDLTGSNPAGWHTGNVGVTGDVSVSSDIMVDEIWSNGNIYMNASSKAHIKAGGYKGLGKGNIWYATGEKNQPLSLRANGNITIALASLHSDVHARGKISVTSDADTADIKAGNNHTEADFFAVDAQKLINAGVKTLSEYTRWEANPANGATTDYQGQLDQGKRPYFPNGFPSDGYYAYESDDSISTNAFSQNFIKPWHYSNGVFVLDDKVNNPANTVEIEMGTHSKVQAFGKLTRSTGGKGNKLISNIEVDCNNADHTTAPNSVSAPNITDCTGMTSAGESATEAALVPLFPMDPPPKGQCLRP